MSQRSDFDFGLTSLVAKFHQDWVRDGGPLDVLAIELWENQNSEFVSALRSDAQILLDELNSTEIETLWNASCDGGIAFGHSGLKLPTGTQWLKLIRDQCDLWLTGHGVTVGQIPRPGRQLASVVVEEVAKVLPEGGVRATLIRCAEKRSPDLAFRFLLRVLIQSNVPLSTAQYELYTEFGKKFGYGEYVVSAVDYLVE